ncbi:MAG: glycosyltransferase family 1 protein [Saprospiraceae bacterium]
MLKIAVNTRFLLPQLEGIGIYTHEICKRLVRNNPDVEFHFFFDRAYNNRFLYAPNVVPHTLFPPARHPYLWHMWYEWAVPRVLKKIAANVFFSPDNFCSLSTDVPSLMVTHDLAFEHYPEHIRSSHLLFFRKYSKKYHDRADMVACVSEYTKQDVIQQYNVPENKTIVTYNGCEKIFNKISAGEKLKLKRKISRGCDYLLHIGALHPRKNVVRLIKAFDIFKKQYPSDIKLVLVGRMAWNNRDLKQAIENSVVKKDIILLGHVENVSALLSCTIGLCYPSLFEGFGIPIIEGFRAGVPVLTSNVSAMPEVAGNAAILVDPFDERGMAVSLNLLVNDTELRKKLIEKGHNRANFFSWNESAVRVMSTLSELL